MGIAIAAYIGLGSNLGDSLSILRQAIKKIGSLQGIQTLKLSRFYQTTPVSSHPQPNYINAVCMIETTLGPNELLVRLQAIESELGKKPKAKDAPRPIDLDILFFGTQCIREAMLEVPHPRWRERLFVLVPLSDLVDVIEVPAQSGICEKFDIQSLIRNFNNVHNETVVCQA